MTTPFSLITRLRSWIFASDRDITMQANRTITLEDGRVVDDELDHVVPIGGVIFWPSTAGAIPANWTTFSAAAGRFLVGAGGSFSNGSTGGAETVDLQHSHAPGTLAASSEGHTHGNGTLATNSESHSHGLNGSALSDHGHSHGAGTLSLTAPDPAFDLNFTANGTSAASGGHTHTVSGTTGSGAGGTAHLLGSTDSQSHSHSAAAGTTASDSHSHTMSGSTATTLSSVQSILPPYLVGTWIQRSS